MPVMDGYELVSNIRQRESSGDHIPIIALTADAARGEKERCIAQGMNDYLSKPVSLVALSKALEIWLKPDHELPENI